MDPDHLKNWIQHQAVTTEEQVMGAAWDRIRGGDTDDHD